MPQPFLVQTLARQKAAGTSFGTYTTAKSVINATELVAMNANYMQVGCAFEIRAWGAISNIVTTPGTVTFQVMIGSIVVWTSGAIQMTTTANTTAPWALDVDLVVRTEGSSTSATMWGLGKLYGLDFTIGSGANPTVTDTVALVPVGTPAAGTGFDSTIADTLDFWVGFSISNSGNAMLVQGYTVKQISGAL